MEGVLTWYWPYIWWALTIIILIYGIWQLNNLVRNNREILPLLAVSGAFMFVLSSLKVPVMASSSHATGTGFSSIAFGPAITTVLAAIVLLFQAVANHGGISTFGANCFAMGFCGPLVACLLFKFLRKSKANLYLTIFIAAFSASIVTYLVTVIQLSLSAMTVGGFFVLSASGFFEEFVKYASVFSPQILIGIIEGLIFVVAFKYIAKVKGDFLVKLKIMTQEELETIQTGAKHGIY
jgi:cobalt/nickel transport system permease protein